MRAAGGLRPGAASLRKGVSHGAFQVAPGAVWHRPADADPGGQVEDDQALPEVGIAVQNAKMVILPRGIRSGHSHLTGLG